MIQRPIFLYALCASQRRTSTNRRLLEALQLACPEGITIAICDLIGDLPVFNPDNEGERTPVIVERFAAEIRKADGLIVSCPEYAHGIPGGFKNALDWLVSRDEVPFKPLMFAHASHRGDLVLALCMKRAERFSHCNGRPAGWLAMATTSIRPIPTHPSLALRMRTCRRSTPT